MNFAEKLKKLRIENNLTHQSMSDLLEIPKRSIGNWECGKRVPPKYVEKLIIEKLEDISKKP